MGEDSRLEIMARRPPHLDMDLDNEVYPSLSLATPIVILKLMVGKLVDRRPRSPQGRQELVDTFPRMAARLAPPRYSARLSQIRHQTGCERVQMGFGGRDCPHSR